MNSETWVTLLREDPRPWIMSSDEPYSKWVILTELMDLPGDDPKVLECRKAIIRDPAVQELISRLPDWEVDNETSGHNNPRFAPNLLNLLADMGIQESDDPRIGRLLDQMEGHKLDDGHYVAFGKASKTNEPVWGWVPCDSHAVAEVLVRFGRMTGRKAQEALSRLEADVVETDQGDAWGCLPHSVTGFRGPGKKSEMCPQVTAQALKAAARVKEDSGRSLFLRVAATLLGAWAGRGDRKPYMFGHGVGFKTVKWPNTWYNAATVLDTLGHYPHLWSGRGADPKATRAVAELAACLVAYNFGPDGKVTPRSCYKGFEGFSFGRKKEPSAFATARLCAILKRFDAIIPLISEIDPLTLSGSKGGTGRVIPPKR